MRSQRLSRRIAPATLLIGLMALLWATGPLQAAERVALVIGNSQYRLATPLKNPRNDAEAMASQLAELGFKVIKGIDVDLFNFKTLIRSFTREIEAADVALFFYAGHGLQVNGRNYLLPIDAKPKRELDLSFDAIDVGLIMQQMERQRRPNILLLDACRDNPLLSKLIDRMGTRGATVGRGLARIETGVGTFVGFATSPGSVAVDGKGNHSPFTEAMLDHLKTPGLDIEVLMRRVRQKVIAATDGEQVPWSNSSLVGDRVVLHPKAERPAEAEIVAPAKTQDARDTQRKPAASATGERAFELAFWDSIKDSRNPQAFEAYLERFPNGAFAGLATVILAEINAKSREVVVEARNPEDAAAEAPDGPDTAAEPEAGSKENEAPAAEQQVASLDPEAPGKPEPAQQETAETVEADPPGLSRRDLALRMQQELDRLGCDPGRPDGIWGPNSRQALANYRRHAGAEFAALEPDAEVLERLQGESARICPLQCGPREIAHGGRCIPKSCPRGRVLAGDGTCIAALQPSKPAKKARKPRRKATPPVVRRKVETRKRRIRRARRRQLRRQRERVFQPPHRQQRSVDPGCPMCDSF